MSRKANVVERCGRGASEGRNEIRDGGHHCANYGKADDDHYRELGRRRNVCHTPPITARAQKYSQILASSSDAVTAANATMNAVIRSWIIVGG